MPSGVTSKVVVDGEYQSLTNSQMNVSASLVSVGAKGVVVFAATPSSTTSTSLYAWAPNQGLTKVVSPGDAVPGTAVTFWTVSLASSLLPADERVESGAFQGYVLWRHGFVRGGARSGTDGRGEER